MTNKYVLGFLFNEIANEVVLIRKNKPTWQKDFLNGVGGKIEQDETAEDAMRREFNEEAGATCKWNQFCIIKGKGWEVNCFRAFDNIAFAKSATQTDEKIEKTLVADFGRRHLVSNVPWLVHMALDDNYGNPLELEINYL